MGALILIEGDASPVIVLADTGIVFNQMSFRPSTVDKHIYAGDSPKFRFLIKNLGAAQSLVGLTVGFGAKVAPAPGSSFLFNVNAPVTDAANGIAEVTLDPSMTQPYGEYVAEISLWGSAVGGRLVATQFPLIIDPAVS